MKKLLNAFLAILIVFLFVRVQMVQGASVSGSFNAKFGGADGACSTSIADDFSSDLSLWTEPWTSSQWAIVTGEARALDRSVLLYTDEQTCTITQWAMAKFIVNPVNSFGGFYFRSQNNESTYAYSVRWEDGTAGDEFVWRYCGGAANSNTGEDCQDIENWIPGTPLDPNDYVGVEISGTGTDTTVKIYDLGTTAIDYADWAISNDQTITLTDNPPQEANTGKYVGLYEGGSQNVYFDDFTAGGP